MMGISVLVSLLAWELSVVAQKLAAAMGDGVDVAGRRGGHSSRLMAYYVF